MLLNDRTSRLSWASFLLGLLLFLSACNPASLNWQDLKVTDLQGQTVNLADYQGKKVLLNFWASWCGPCIAELPSMVEAHAALGEEVTFVLLSDEAPDVIANFARQKALPFEMLHLKTSFQVAGIVSIPQTYLIGSDGVIVDAVNGSHNWASPEKLKFLRTLP